MCAFRDEQLKLPLPSWNLWENSLGVHTFTCSTVVGGLRAAAKFAYLFGDTERGEIYENTASEIVFAMHEHLYSKKLGRFLRGLQFYDDGNFEPDTTIDASLFGAFYFGAFDAEDECVRNTVCAIEKKLWIKTDVGGVARFERDDYMQVSDDIENVAGNPWFICTLWLAEYRIAVANDKKDLEKAVEILEWTAKNSLPSGILAEQLHPETGEPVSVSPLTWSHSTFVAAVMNYLRKNQMLKA